MVLGKERRMFRPLLFNSFAILLAAPTLAAPWADVGDRQLRMDVEILKSAGVIRGPVNSWPLPWAQIDNGINSIGNAPLAPHVAAALARVRALSDRARATNAFEVMAAATNKVQLVRDFGGGARERADVAFHGEIDTGAFFVSYGAGYRSGQVGPDYHFEPGYVAVKTGNWAVYVGFTEVWFGPGNDGTLLFSNSARPFPKIGLRRLSPDPLNIPILKWLGPVKVEAFAGILNEDRDYENPLVMGMRVAFEPVPGLEIGLHRAIQMCGSDRPCNARSFGKAWFGLGNADNGNLDNDPGNQLAGFDASYARMIGNVTAKAYVEALAEDRRNLSLAHYARLGGIQASGPLGGKGAMWTGFVEWSDTQGAKLFGGGVVPGSLYNNFIYTSGFTYKGRPIGHSLDGDTQVLTVSGSVTDTRNRRYYASFRHIDLNLSADQFAGVTPPRQRISQSRETIRMVTAGAELPTRIGDIRIEARLQDDAPDTPGTSKLHPAIELALRSRF
jgi:Capsule assembly protein Wzi